MDAGLKLRPLELADAPVISAAFTAIGWHKPVEKYQRYLAEQHAGERDVIVALMGEVFAGYGNVVWKAGYPPFREAGIPEIQDLNVLPPFRRRGVATAIMDEAERLIARRSAVAGIGVGLYGDYGPAQRMYILRGYLPDGRGITYRGQFVAAGAEVMADDDLVLWLTKRLDGDRS
jgi:GNAT superfamily N-acetyltransferase